MLLENLAQVVTARCGLVASQPVLIGVSGGVDSLVLMYVLKNLGYTLVVAHVDHGLRPESRDEAKNVQQLAESFGLPFNLERIDVAKFAEEHGQSIEEAARAVRYHVLFAQARKHQCQAVAVGHHADDQVETVLMHLLRGAGLPGLTGMDYRRVLPIWDPEIPLVRPLLAIWRDEIEAFAALVGLTPNNDQSNLDTTFHRNRIRHELIPILETYNPNIRSVLWRMSDVLSEEDHFLDNQSQSVFARCLVHTTDDYVIIHLAMLLNQHTAIKRRVLRLVIAQLRPNLRDIGFDLVSQVLHFLMSPIPNKEVDLGARLSLVIVDDYLVIKDWDADIPDFGQPLLPDPAFNKKIDLNQPVGLRNDWQIRAELIDVPPKTLLEAVKNLSKDEIWLDYDRVSLPLCIRGRKAGERFRPLGMEGGTVSLQDFFVNLKIPAYLRALWPLVVVGESIAWVVGVRPAEEFKITAETKRILSVRILKSPS